jgi:hypothetical protein
MEEQLRIKASLAVHWADLSTVFNHYGSTDSGMEPLGMGADEAGKSLQMAEWMHLCCVAGVCPGLLPVHAVRSVFTIANEDRSSMKAQGGDDGRTDSMSHFEFLEAIILLGEAVYGRMMDASIGRLGAAGGFQAILHQHIVPLAVWIRTGQLHRQLYDPAMQMWLRPRMGAIRAVFSFYSASDAREASAVHALVKGHTQGIQVLGSTALKFKTGGAASTRHTLSLREFAVLLEHCGLVSLGTANACAEYTIAVSNGKAFPPSARGSYTSSEQEGSGKGKSGTAGMGGKDKDKGGPLLNKAGYEMRVLGLDSHGAPMLVEVDRAAVALDAPLVYEAFCAAQVRSCACVRGRACARASN